MYALGGGGARAFGAIRDAVNATDVTQGVHVIVVILALVYVGTEIVLSVLGQPALLLGPAAAFTGVVGLPTDMPAGIGIAVGAGMALVGLILIVLAVKPGRLSKHALTPAGDTREDRDEIRRVTDAELPSYGLDPAVRTSVRVEQKKDEVVR